MDSTKEGQSDDERESEDEEDEEEVEGSGSEVVDGSGSEEMEGLEVEAGAVLASGEEPGHEGEEEPSGSARLERPHEQGNAEPQSQEEPPCAESRSSSPTSQIASQVEKRLSVNASDEKQVRNKAAIDALKGRAREKQKYHSRRGAERIGRPKGSKAKQDNRVQVDRSGLWD